tara:strand:+ start:572 stop:745 length:174 start_codon:yes stop_codon:yes gene_type:complete
MPLILKPKNELLKTIHSYIEQLADLKRNDKITTSKRIAILNEIGEQLTKEVDYIYKP